MNANIKKIWLKALRSGEYEQTTTRLCRPRSDGVGFCCLGVLCDLYTIETDLGEFEDHSSDVARESFMYRCDSGQRAVTYLPEEIADWSGLDLDEQTVLAKKNDCKGFSFDQIADYVEEQL